MSVQVLQRKNSNSWQPFMILKITSSILICLHTWESLVFIYIAISAR